MSQTWDIDLINPSTTSPFTDITRITDGFNALRTLFSGASAPSDTTPYMWWADTTTNLLKQRDAADSTFITRASLAESFLLAKTTAYTTVAADRGNTILADATSAGFTVTLLAAATAGDGHEIAIKKTDSSTNVVTVDANGSETIDGDLTKLLQSQYDILILRSDGTNWHVISFFPSNNIKIATKIAAASQSTMTFSAIPAGTKRIKILFEGLSLADANEDILVRIGDSGSTDSTGYISTAFSTASTSSSTTSFLIRNQSVSRILTGEMFLDLLDEANDIWVSVHQGKLSTTEVANGSGDKTISGDLDIIEIVAGAASTFDAGSVTITFE